MPPFNPYSKRRNTSSTPSVGSCILKNDSGSKAQNIPQVTLSNECQKGRKMTMPPQPSGINLSQNDTPSHNQTSTLMSKVEAKVSVTPSPTLKVPLKQQLKYEIAMLKKQKKDRIMAKQRAIQPVTQEQQSESTIYKEGEQQPTKNVDSNTSHQKIVAVENKLFASVPISSNTKLNTNTAKITNTHNNETSNLFKPVYPMHIPMYLAPHGAQSRPSVMPMYHHFHPVTHNALYHGAPSLHHQQVPHPLAPMHYQSSNTPIPAIPKAPPMFLHKDPLNNSFFGKTHCLLKTQIAVVKKEGDSFGINLKYEKKMNSKTKEICGVLMVTNANIQNLRAKPGTNQANLLQKGDIITSINSKQTFGLEFREATGLFSKCIPIQEPNTLSDSSNRSQYICNLTVARDKKRAKVLALLENLSLDTTKSLSVQGAFGPAPPKVPFIVHEATGIIPPNSDFNSLELNALITGYVEYQQGKVNEDIFSDILLKPIGMKYLRQRTVIDCIKKWDHMSKILELEMSGKAISHWKALWKEEADGEEQKISERDFVSDSERSFLRQRPRPTEGCKCGSKEHQFVNHPDCFLYRNLKKGLDASVLLANETLAKSSERIAKYDALLKNKTLNSIGNAHLQRMKNQLEEQEAERNEAVFVNQMEQIQSKLGIAVFAPTHKSVMVLSAIASCEEKLVDLSECDEHPTENKSTRDPKGSDDSDDESDDDDIPLNAALGKRSATSSKENERKSKTARFSRKVTNFVSLGSILEHISTTWGHVFKDPVPIEEVWSRHCTLKGYTDHSYAPQKLSKESSTGYSFELAKFALSKINAKDKMSDKDKFAIAYLASDAKTGLLQEIQNCIFAGLVEVKEDGALKMATDWESAISPHILYDMFEGGWSSKDDESNKFCIHPIIRNGLESKWTRTSVGWVNKCFPNRVVVLDEEYIRLRQTFIDKYEEYDATGAGIHQFGV